MTRRICLIANKKSGQNSRDAEAIDRAMAALGDGAWRLDWDAKTPIETTMDKALEDDPEIIVAAGGDGTVMAVAGALLGKGVPMAVLPLGTFNFFARGLGLSEEPERAAAEILNGHPHDIRIGKVNDQAFLNNASLGVYPAILRERETVYSRWGRFRVAAHWSVIKTFLKFRKPMRMTITADGTRETRRSALVFVARSAYQLERFGIEGSDAIDDDRFAVLIARASTRKELFAMTFRLALGKPLRGRDYDLLTPRELTIETRRRRALLAFDGEKVRAAGPFHFHMAEERLTIILPEQEAAS